MAGRGLEIVSTGTACRSDLNHTRLYKQRSSLVFSTAPQRALLTAAPAQIKPDVGTATGRSQKYNPLFPTPQSTS